MPELSAATSASSAMASITIAIDSSIRPKPSSPATLAFTRAGSAAIGRDRLPGPRRGRHELERVLLVVRGVEERRRLLRRDREGLAARLQRAAGDHDLRG